MNKKIPLSVQHLLNEKVEKYNELAFVETSGNNILELRDSEFTSDFYFHITDFRRVGHRNVYDVDYKPRSQDILEAVQTSYEINELLIRLTDWFEILIAFENAGTIFNTFRTNNPSTFEMGNEIPNLEEQMVMNDKLDLIIDHLKRLEMGEEIIFDEISELKELYSKLSKKNWKEIFLGKMFDMGLSKAVEPDVIKYIFNEFGFNNLTKLIG